MCWLWPYDGLAIAPCDQKQPPAMGWRAIVGGVERSPLDHIAEIAELADPPSECFALAALVRHHHRLAVCRHHGLVVRIASMDQWSPLFKLADVFQHNYAGLHQLRPLHHDPCQAPDLLLNWFAALG